MQKWKLKDIMLLAFVAFFFGAVFIVANFLYNAIEPFFVPLGLGPFVNEILFGLWTVAGPVAFALIPKVGSATLGEVLAAIAEMVYGSQFGFAAVISGIVQGFGSEIGIAWNHYQRPSSLKTLSMSALTLTMVSYLYEYFKLGYTNLSLGMAVSLFIVRLISVFITNVIFVRTILKLFNRSEKLK